MTLKYWVNHYASHDKEHVFTLIIFYIRFQFSILYLKKIK